MRHGRIQTVLIIACGLWALWCCCSGGVRPSGEQQEQQSVEQPLGLQSPNQIRDDWKIAASKEGFKKEQASMRRPLAPRRFNKTEASVNIMTSLKYHKESKMTSQNNANKETVIASSSSSSGTSIATERSGLYNSSSSSSSSNNNVSPAAFIHLGKTGGSNLARILRNGCHSFRPKPCKDFILNETMVSKLVQDYYHVPKDTQQIPQSNHSIYILTSRDPYERFVSAFVYLHPKNKATFHRLQSGSDMYQKYMAYKCFPTLQSFVDYIGDDPFRYDYTPKKYVNSRDCTTLARAIAAGQVEPLEHLYNNFQHMAEWIPSSLSSSKEQQQQNHNQNHPLLYMIRQEHLWEDWIVVNRDYLGQTEPVVLPDDRSRRNVTTFKIPPVTKYLNGEGRRRLCRTLEPEYRAYFDLLRRARNILPRDGDDNDDGDDGAQEAVELGKVQCPNWKNMSAFLAAAAATTTTH
jgi:hypothetical protein